MATERIFVDGKMVVTFPNGRTREVTVEQLEIRKGRVADVVARRSGNMQKTIDRLTGRIANEEDIDKKAKMKAKLVKINERKDNAPTAQMITDRIQGWIDLANASV